MKSSQDRELHVNKTQINNWLSFNDFQIMLNKLLGIKSLVHSLYNHHCIIHRCPVMLLPMDYANWFSNVYLLPHLYILLTSLLSKWKESCPVMCVNSLNFKRSLQILTMAVISVRLRISELTSEISEPMFAKFSQLPSDSSTRHLRWIKIKF